HSHRCRPQTKPDQRSATVELRQIGGIDAPLTVIGSLGVIFHGGLGQISDQPPTPRHPSKHFIELVPGQETCILPKLHLKMCFWVTAVKSRGDSSQSVTYEVPDHERFLKHSDKAIAKVRMKCTGVIRLFDRQ
ncbi:hypothetical protein GGR95_003527, partial [Sulfitobacter undariae]